ncbi:MAG: DUF3108 domain-containing protein [Marinobacter sp.]
MQRKSFVESAFPGLPLLLSLVLSVCLIVFVTPALADAGSESVDSPQLTPFEASFSASIEQGITLSGSAKRILSNQNNGVWLYRTSVKSFVANIEESVVLKWQDGQVIPLRYRYKLSGLLIRDREETIDFDWKKNLATGRYKDKAFEIVLSPGLLDPLGYQLQLHQDIKAGKREMAYQYVRHGRLDEDRFAVINEGSITTPQGEIDALTVEKLRDEGAKRATLMWFAPKFDHLLVQLLQTEPDGSRYELNLKSIKQL